MDVSTARHPQLFAPAWSRWPVIALMILFAVLFLVLCILQGLTLLRGTGSGPDWSLLIPGFVTIPLLADQLTTRYVVEPDAVRIHSLFRSTTIAASSIGAVGTNDALRSWREAPWPGRGVVLRTASGRRLAVVYPGDPAGFRRAVEAIITDRAAGRGLTG